MRKKLRHSCKQNKLRDSKCVNFADRFKQIQVKRPNKQQIRRDVLKKRPRDSKSSELAQTFKAKRPRMQIRSSVHASAGTPCGATVWDILIPPSKPYSETRLRRNTHKTRSKNRNIYKLLQQRNPNSIHFVFVLIYSCFAKIGGRGKGRATSETTTFKLMNTYSGQPQET